MFVLFFVTAVSVLLPKINAENAGFWKMPIEKAQVKYHHSTICITIKGVKNCVDKSKTPGDPKEVAKLFQILQQVNSSADDGKKIGNHDKESDSKESNSKEGNSNEGNSKEGDNNEGNSKEGNNNESNSKEGDNNEGNNEKSNNNESNTKEGDNKKSNNEEGNNEESNSKEGDNNEGNNEESNSKEGNNNEGNNEEGNSKEGNSKEEYTRTNNRQSSQEDNQGNNREIEFPSSAEITKFVPPHEAMKINDKRSSEESRPNKTILIIEGIEAKVCLLLKCDPNEFNYLIVGRNKPIVKQQSTEENIEVLTPTKAVARSTGSKSSLHKQFLDLSKKLERHYKKIMKDRKRFLYL